MEYFTGRVIRLSLFNPQGFTANEWLPSDMRLADNPPYHQCHHTVKDELPGKYWTPVPFPDLVKHCGLTVLCLLNITWCGQEFLLHTKVVPVGIQSCVILSCTKYEYNVWETMNVKTWLRQEIHFTGIQCNLLIKRSWKNEQVACNMIPSPLLKCYWLFYVSRVWIGFKFWLGRLGVSKLRPMGPKWPFSCLYPASGKYSFNWYETLFFH